MKRYLLTAGLFALAVTFAALAQTPQSALAQFGGNQKAKKGGGFPDPQSQFGGGGFGGGLALYRITALEEEFELTEAQRDIRKAYVKAAEVGVKGAEVNFDRINRIRAAGTVTQEELDKARLEVEAAKAQLEIRTAELKEIEVKVKYAKKRLDDIRRPGGAPAKIDPKPVDPPGK